MSWLLNAGEDTVVKATRERWPCVPGWPTIAQRQADLHAQPERHMAQVCGSAVWPGLFRKVELEVSAMLGQSPGSSDSSMVGGVMLTE